MHRMWSPARSKGASCAFLGASCAFLGACALNEQHRGLHALPGSKHSRQATSPRPAAGIWLKDIPEPIVIHRVTLPPDMPIYGGPTASRCNDENEIMRQLTFDADFWPQLNMYVRGPTSATIGDNFLQDFTNTLSDLATDQTHTLRFDFRKYPFMPATDLEWRTACINLSSTLIWKLTGARRDASMPMIAGNSIVIKGVQIGNDFIGTP